MNNTANRETESVKKVFGKLSKDDAFALLKKIGTDNFKFVSIENKWSESDNHKSIICNLAKEIREETAEAYIDLKHGQPTTDQVFDAVYGKGAKCKIRIIIYDGEISEEDNDNPAANEFVVWSLIAAMNEYPLYLYLVELKGEDIEKSLCEIDDFEELEPEYSIEEIPTLEEFRIDEFWDVYFDSLNEGFYSPWKAFSEGLRNPKEWHWMLYTEQRLEIPL